MAWNAPVIRAAGYLISDSDWNDIAYDDMRYLKGLDGVVQIEDLLSFPHFGDFIDIIDWQYDGGFGVTKDATATVLFGVPVLYMATAATINQSAYVVTDRVYSNMVVAAKEVQAEFLINNLGAITNQTIFLHFTKDSASPPSEIADHFGFRITNADIYASNGDGATQKVTDTTSNVATGAQWTRLRVVLMPGTNCKFYVDDVLKITHTLNLPTAGDYYLHVGILTAANEDKEIYLGRVAVRRKY